MRWRCGTQVDNMNVMGGWAGQGLFRRRRKRGGGELLLIAQTLGRPAALILMVTGRLVGALASGREDE